MLRRILPIFGQKVDVVQLLSELVDTEIIIKNQSIHHISLSKKIIYKFQITRVQQMCVSMILHTKNLSPTRLGIK
jgi:hypothetical protein